MILTRRHRIKDVTTAKWLERHARAVKVRYDAVTYLKRRYRFWCPCPKETPHKASRGREASTRALLTTTSSATRLPAMRAVDIDLGLKSLAVFMTGETIDNPRHFPL